MSKRILTILYVFAATALICFVYAAYLFYVFLDSGPGDAGGFGIIFAFFIFTPLFLFGETIIFGFIFIKHLKEVYPILLPTLLITGIIPIYMAYEWHQSRAIEVPPAGQLPVSIQQYNLDGEQIISDYKLTDLDSNNARRHYKDTIMNIKIDTIIYSTDKTKFFSIMMVEIKNEGKTEFWAEYRTGRKYNDSWQLFYPAGAIWIVSFDSIPKFKNEIRKYFYNTFSINGSSNKPDIWKKEGIF